MWYGGHDGSTGRVLTAEQRRNEGWARSGVSIEAGLAGSTDRAGVGAPSVIHWPAGFVMAYAGTGSKTTQPHLATSDDGRVWKPLGPFSAPGDRTAGSHNLIETEGQLRMFYVSEGSDGRPAVFEATSADGTIWQDAGPVLEPEPDEQGLSDPWVVVRETGFLMLFVGDRTDDEPSIGLATSSDGQVWARHPLPLDLGRRHHDAGVISGPSAYDLGGRHLRVWYAAGAEGTTTGECRLWSVDLAGAPS
jgi:predicted GH43/DUF377 family glycosyl hydrolase